MTILLIILSHFSVLYSFLILNTQSAIEIEAKRICMAANYLDVLELPMDNINILKLKSVVETKLEFLGQNKSSATVHKAEDRLKRIRHFVNTDQILINYAENLKLHKHSNAIRIATEIPTIILE